MTTNRPCCSHTLQPKFSCQAEQRPNLTFFFAFNCSIPSWSGTRFPYSSILITSFGSPKHALWQSTNSWHIFPPSVVGKLQPGPLIPNISQRPPFARHASKTPGKGVGKTDEISFGKSSGIVSVVWFVWHADVNMGNKSTDSSNKLRR